MMTMGRTKEIPAGEFKSRCLALLEEVGNTGTELIVTKRGRPVAKVVPIDQPKSLIGSVIYEGDIISPLEDEWDVSK